MDISSSSVKVASLLRCLRRVDWQIYTGVSKGRSAFNFGIYHSTLSCLLGRPCPVREDVPFLQYQASTWLKNKKVFNLYEHGCQNVKSLSSLATSCRFNLSHVSFAWGSELYIYKQIFVETSPISLQNLQQMQWNLKICVSVIYLQNWVMVA